MKKINLQKPVHTLGVPVVDANGNVVLIGKDIAMHLNAMNTENPLKNDSICLRLYEKGEVELDGPDFEFLKGNIMACKTAPDYLRTAALKEIALQTEEK